MEEKYENEIKRLKSYNQNEFVDIISKLNNEESAKILEQVSILDLNEIKELYKNIGKSEEKSNSKIEPISAIDKEKLSQEELNKYEMLGEKIIKNNKYAVITMAGGQRNKTWV